MEGEIAVRAAAVEAALAGHPAVRRARVVPAESALVAYVEPIPEILPSGTEEAGHLAQWKSLWSDTYTRSTAEGDPPLNLAGWLSSYTGRPIAEREMREWVDRTVERILALSPRRLLEIGCGMGLLLGRIAPASEEYWATDFSAEAVAYVERTQAGGKLPITLRRQPADDLGDLPPGRFDTIVLNSVVQYFPDLGYLRRVLAGLLTLAAPGARIFLGDLRSLPLLSTFQASILLQQADAETPLAELRERLDARIRRERELVIDPAFFAALARSEPALAGVEIQLKGGRARNEMTRFRYDVVLTLHGGAAPPGPPERWLDWTAEGLSLPALRRLISAGAAGEGAAPRSLGLTGIPNARLAAEVEAEALLAQPDLATVADLQAALRGRRPPVPAVEPEELWALSRDLPYRVEVRWGASPGTFDAVLRHEEATETAAEPTAAAGEAAEGADLAVHANSPLRERLAEELSVELERYLAERLPGREMPVRFVLVETAF
jgi:SAM-dependent methyltransferase